MWFRAKQIKNYLGDFIVKFSKIILSSGLLLSGLTLFNQETKAKEITFHLTNTKQLVFDDAGSVKDFVGQVKAQFPDRQVSKVLVKYPEKEEFTDLSEGNEEALSSVLFSTAEHLEYETQVVFDEEENTPRRVMFVFPDGKVSPARKKTLPQLTENPSQPTREELFKTLIHLIGEMTRTTCYYRECHQHGAVAGKKAEQWLTEFIYAENPELFSNKELISAELLQELISFVQARVGDEIIATEQEMLNHADQIRVDETAKGPRRKFYLITRSFEAQYPLFNPKRPKGVKLEHLVELLKESNEIDEKKVSLILDHILYLSGLESLSMARNNWLEEKAWREQSYIIERCYM